MSKKLLAALAVSGLTTGAFPRTLGSTRHIEDNAGMTAAGLYITADNARDGGGPAHATTVAQSADGKADVANTAIDSDVQKPAMQQQQAGANTGQADSVKAGVTQAGDQQQQQ